MLHRRRRLILTVHPQDVLTRHNNPKKQSGPPRSVKRYHYSPPGSPIPASDPAVGDPNWIPIGFQWDSNEIPIVFQ